MKKHVSVGNEDRVGNSGNDGLMLGDDDDEGVIQGDQVILGDEDEEDVWLIDGTADGARTNGRTNRVAFDGDKDGLMLGYDDDEGVVEGDEDRLVLGDRDEDDVQLIGSTADGVRINGRKNRVASLNPKSPPSAINAPFDVTL